MVHSQHGRLENINGKDYIFTEKGQAGFCLYGPYEILQPGKYYVEQKLSLTENIDVESGGSICGEFDICTDKGKKVLSKTNIYIARINKKPNIQLAFQLSNPAEVEYRVYTYGKTSFIVDCERTIKTLPESDNFTPIFNIGTDVSDEFFRQHQGQFRHIFELGADIGFQEQTPIIEFQDVSLFIKREEHFQIAYDVFVRHVYNFSSNRDMVFFDVGMNCGFTSLYAARMNHVREVHAFEPFAIPFKDAHDNFRLNPGLAKKIFPYPFGLGDADQCLNVFAATENTIGTSVRGETSGQRETIKIRNAADVLGDLFLKARQKGCGIVVKLDCEGCEFPIFEILASRNLIGEPDVYLIEWHKWWSADRSAKDFILPLLDKDFVVLDHTEASDRYAGTVYAIKRNAIIP